MTARLAGSSVDVGFLAIGQPRIVLAEAGTALYTAPGVPTVGQEIEQIVDSIQFA